jgi:hypothetical protein
MEKIIPALEASIRLVQEVSCSGIQRGQAEKGMGYSAKAMGNAWLHTEYGH